MDCSETCKLADVIGVLAIANGSIRDECHLLFDALAAAHRGDKNHVVIDHLERAISGLVSTADRIQSTLESR